MATNVTAARERFDLESFDYFDFGCSAGANMAFVKGIWPTMRGLGIDIDPRKVEQARAAGHDAIVFDILKLPPKKLVQFVTLSHFLEHLDGIALARSMVLQAIRVASDFVVIRQPWFDGDGALFMAGLKFYWSHWHGHRNPMTTLAFHSMLAPELAAGRIRSFAIYGRGEVKSSAHPALLPISAPIDQHSYDEKVHGPKPVRELGFPLFKEVVVCIEVGEEGGSKAMLGHMEPLTLLHRA